MEDNNSVRTYEEDLDYVLERDIDTGSIKGPEKKVVVGVENYGEVYNEKSCGGGMEDPAPYHTRYDSKPFSYIR